MKRFITLLISGGIAWWAWWYTFDVDPGGDGFGFEACSDGEGVCSSDPSVFTLIVAIIAGIVAFFTFISWIRLVGRKLKGEEVAKPSSVMTGTSNPGVSMTGWAEQVGASLQQGVQALQQAQSGGYVPPGYPAPGYPAAGNSAAGNSAAGNSAAGSPAAGNPAAGNPAMVGQAGVIGGPAAGTPAAGAPPAGSPAAGNPALGAPAARTPTAADRAASRDRWLTRASGAGPGGAAASATSGEALTGVAAYDPTPTRTTGTTGASRAVQASSAAAAATHPATASVVLVSVGPRDLGVQREVRRLTGFGLEEAKQLMASVASTPQYVAVDLPWDEAQQVKRTLDRMGATVELR
jgi:ribosomal protein L7/L12